MCPPGFPRAPILPMRLPQCIGTNRCTIKIEDLARLGMTDDPGRPPAPVPLRLREGRRASIASLPWRSFGPYIGVECDCQYRNKVIRNDSRSNRRNRCLVASPVIPLIDRLAPLHGEAGPLFGRTINRLLSV